MDIHYTHTHIQKRSVFSNGVCMSSAIAWPFIFFVPRNLSPKPKEKARENGLNVVNGE